MNYKWENISYLLNGTNKQIRAFKTLNEIKIFDILKRFSPILVGTIPININIENSDLDIICEVYDFDEFVEILNKHFKEMKGFNLDFGKREEIRNVYANFEYNGFIIEVFGQPLPTKKQHGYRHMIIEERLLKLGGENFKREIVKLKEDGLKTEPAFTRYLNIEGNPYFELLKLEGFSDEELLEMINVNT